jgi:hypothetical protein
MPRHPTRTGAAPLVVKTTVDCSRLGVVETVAWKTGKWCMQCCHPFPSIDNVVVVPTGADGKGEWFGSDGAFCSYPCARRYVWQKFHNNKHRRDPLLLHLGMAAKKNGADPDDGRMAPLRRELGVFGGEMTIEEYRRNNSGVDKIVVAWTPRVAGGAIGFPAPGGGGALRQQQMPTTNPPTTADGTHDRFQQYVGKEKSKRRAKRPRSAAKGPLSAFFKKTKK